MCSLDMWDSSWLILSWFVEMTVDRQECTKHMIGDQNKFITLKEEKRDSVTFEDNASARIVGKGIISIDNGNTKT